MIRYFYIIILSFILNSCETREELAKIKLIGQWEIREMSFNGKNCKEDLLINSLSFRENGFSIPEIYTYPAEDENFKNEWNLKTDKDGHSNLDLKCYNKVFNGSYRLIFFKNQQEKLLGIKIKSKTTTIVAYKFWQDFDLHRNWDTEY